MPRQSNQFKVVPDEILKPALTHYYSLGLSDIQILKMMKGKYDSTKYSLSLITIRRRRKEWNLPSVAKQGKMISAQELDTICKHERKKFPRLGGVGMKRQVKEEFGWNISKAKYFAWFQQNEPAAARQRQIAARFRRRIFFAAGVNHLMTVDQHDKWRRFGLFLHVATEPFSGHIHWLKVWWTNSNPRLILSYYLDAVRMMRGIPLLTQSDPGTENYGIAKAQTYLRHRLDPSLEGTLQHKFRYKVNNIKPEIEWSLLRRFWSIGFEKVLTTAIDLPEYDETNHIHTLIFRWTTIPWIQKELDQYRNRQNKNARRKDPYKVLPHGIPDLIFEEPEYFDAVDLKISVPPELFDEVAEIWAPSDHEVFQLVPAAFNNKATEIWDYLGRPTIDFNSFVSTFQQMLIAFEGLGPNPIDHNGTLIIREAGWTGGEADKLELDPNLKRVGIQECVGKPVPFVELTDEGEVFNQGVLGPNDESDEEYTIGYVNGELFVEFTDEEDNEESDIDI